MTAWAALGWAGNACFFSRFLVQWRDAERSGSDRATRSFWLLSLAGSLLVGTYTAHRGHAVLLAGFVTNGVIYLRNLEIAMRPRITRLAASRPITLVALLSVAVLVAAGVADAAAMATLDRSHEAWLACAVVGQGIWGSRFALQWWCSERAGRSHFPIAFWQGAVALDLACLLLRRRPWLEMRRSAMTSEESLRRRSFDCGFYLPSVPSLVRRGFRGGQFEI